MFDKYEDEFINTVHFAIVDAIKNDEKALCYFNKHKNDPSTIWFSLDIAVIAAQQDLDDLRGN